MNQENQVEEENRNYFKKVYLWMFLGLFVSGLTSYLVSLSSTIMLLILGNKIMFFGLVIFELLLVVSLVGLIKKIPAKLAIFLFLFYSFVTGLTLSIIFIVYTITSIGLVFFITAGMFLVLSLVGYTTKLDLSKFGVVLFVGLLGIIIASVANIFLQNSILDIIISIVGVIIFTGLIVYDTKKIKELNIIGNEGTEEDTKEAVIGALTLYLDFINLFLHLLKLLGKRRD